MNVTQKIVLISGGAQGIGKGIVKKFLHNNYSVIIADFDQEAGNETIEEFKNLGNIIFIPTDVCEEKQIIHCINKGISVFNKIDILINNAACTKTLYQKLKDLKLDEWNKTIQTNLTSVFLFSKYCEKYLKENYGSIINIASTRAYQSEPDTFAYSATKGAIISLTHSLAISLGPEIKVNSISPGWIDTGEWLKTSSRKKYQLTELDHKQHPCGRVGIVEDIANMAFFLVQPENSFITGQDFIIDGGMTKKMIYV